MGLFDYDKHKPWAKDLTIVMQLGLTMAGCVVFCFFVGRALDGWLGLKGPATVIFTVLGVIGGGNVCYRQIQEIFEDAEKEEEARKTKSPPENGNS